MRPHVKWAAAVRRVRDLAPAVERAYREAQAGVPGPRSSECPIDLLYDEATVRQLYGAGSGGRSLADLGSKVYLGARVGRGLRGAANVHISGIQRQCHLGLILLRSRR
ncbi:MAG: hypothetical protein U0074_02375 [Kouleothrix sp.]